MRIGINLLYLIPGVVGGTETYARGLIRAIGESDWRNEYLLFVNEEARNERFSDAPNIRTVVCPVRASSRARRYIWEQTVFPARLRAHGVDLVHSLGYVGPIAAPCPHVLTIPDANWVGHPTMSQRRRAFLRAFVGATAARAVHLVAISEFSRQQIHRHLGRSLDEISVTHLAGRPHQAASPAAIAGVRARYGVDGPFVIAFSSMFAHKNIPRLINAFAGVVSSRPHRLVLVGHAPAELSAKIAEFPSLAGRVSFTGFVPDEDVVPMMAAAELLVFPSLYEGFGLPLIDAQSVGVPIASSNAGSLPEVGGDGAVYFDPTSIEDMRSAIVTCLDDQALRRTLVERGLVNEKRFTWANTAQTTLRVYERFAAPTASRAR